MLKDLWATLSGSWGPWQRRCSEVAQKSGVTPVSVAQISLTVSGPVCLARSPLQWRALTDVVLQREHGCLVSDWVRLSPPRGKGMEGTSDSDHC